MSPTGVAVHQDQDFYVKGPAVLPLDREYRGAIQWPKAVCRLLFMERRADLLRSRQGQCKLNSIAVGWTRLSRDHPFREM